MSSKEEKKILENILLELEHVISVISSCKSKEQFDVAMDWSMRWRLSRMNLLKNAGYSKNKVEEIFNMKHFHVFKYNIN
mgnify:CR=1 FL=1